MDLRKLKKLIDLVQESGIAELEITEGEEKVRISRSGSNVQTAVMAMPQSPVPVTAPAATTPSAAAETAAPAEPEGHVVKSPMVGTFYRAPAPDALPYVEVGSRVSKGDTLCMIEAMKLMNELESEIDGTVAEICVENAEPVEYGQVLFRIRPRAASSS